MYIKGDTTINVDFDGMQLSGAITNRTAEVFDQGVLVRSGGASDVRFLPTAPIRDDGTLEPVSAVVIRQRLEDGFTGLLIDATTLDGVLGIAADGTPEAVGTVSIDRTYIGPSDDFEAVFSGTETGVFAVGH